MSIIESINHFNKTVSTIHPVELEVRFNPIKNKSEFENVYNTLLNYGFKREAEKHILKICFSDKKKTGYMNCETDSTENIRSEILGLQNIKEFCNNNRIPENTVHVKKTKLESVTNKDYGFKIVLSKEIPCNEMEINRIEQTFKKSRKTFRLMNRLTLKNPEMPGFIIDMSIVKMKINSSKLSESGIFESIEIYELEIELEEHDKPIDDIINISNYVKKTIKYILCGKNDTDFPISEEVKQEIMNEYKNLFTTSKYVSFIGPSSYTLQKANLSLDHTPCIKKDFCVTDKADGLRKLLYIAKNNQIYFITNTNPMNIQYIGRSVIDDTLRETLMDGEYIKYDKNHNRIDLFAVFDIYFYKEGEKLIDIRKEGFETTRYPKLKEIVKKIRDNSSETLYRNSISVNYKEFRFINDSQNLYLQCQYILDKIESSSYIYNTDGIIFSSSTLGVGMETKDDTVKNKKYAWKHSFKWKPPEFNTIDFLIKFPKNDKDEILTEMIYNKNDKTTKKYQIIYLYVGNGNTDETVNPQLELLNGVQSSNSKDDIILFIPTNPFDGNAYMAYLLLEDNGNIYVEEENITGENDVIYNNNVVEFKYVMNEDKRLSWVPLRIRYDKSRGNNKNTANSNWNSIHNPVTRLMLTDPSVEVDYDIITENPYYNKVGVVSKTKNMRDFHNKFVKKTLYAKYCKDECNIIDYAVGKAGDLHKWLDSNSPFVLGIDLSKDNINNIKDGACSRYIRTVQDKQKHKYIFIEGNTGEKINEKNEFAQGNKISEDVMNHVLGISKSKFVNLPKFGIVSKGFDLGSIQFALHYMFESKRMVHNFMWNCSKTIKLNGYLIGTCYDGELVYDLLDILKLDEHIQLSIDGTKIFHIKKKYDKPNNFKEQKEPFGYKIGVFQDSINTENDEYLVHFNYFESLMENYGFKLLHLDSFETYYKKYKTKNLSKEETKISFLNKAFVFQKINEVDPNLVYEYNTKESVAKDKSLFITSKPTRLKSKITLNK